MSKRSSGRSPHRANGESKSRVRIAGRNGHMPHQRGAATRKRRVSLLPSVHSEQGHEALLRAGAGAKSDSLEVDYSRHDVQFLLSGRGMPLLSGAWETDISFDGRPVDCQGAWEASCWNADEDADFLELTLETKSGVRIERQFLLPRKGQLAFFADSVVAPSNASLRYRSRLPLAQGIRGGDESATNAANIRGNSAFARIFPLSLPTERSLATTGRLNAVAGSIELRQETVGRALYAPLVIDWSPQRRKSSFLWRPLTVSELRRPVASDVAAGYRLQVGASQWLVYHSLQNSGEPRTVLGHHTWYETVIGSFSRTGAVDPFIQIEMPHS